MTRDSEKTTTSQKTQKKSVPIELIRTSGKYSIGPAARPKIIHDNGFLDQFTPEEPDMSDRAQLAYWRTKLEGAEALRPDLVDATAAYRHFLYGLGHDRTLNYERFIENDTSGAILIKNLTSDFQNNITIIGKNRDSFLVTSQPFSVGNTNLYPYPATENWQKAIGAHIIWVSGSVKIETDANGIDAYDAEITIHMEDRYNFNPGAADIATGIPDSANGRFEITGLAKQYMNYGTITRQLKWKHKDGSKPEQLEVSGDPRSRQRRPSDSRRARNRI